MTIRTTLRVTPCLSIIALTVLIPTPVLAGISLTAYGIEPILDWKLVPQTVVLVKPTTIIVCHAEEEVITSDSLEELIEEIEEYLRLNPAQTKISPTKIAPPQTLAHSILGDEVDADEGYTEELVALNRLLFGDKSRVIEPHTTPLRFKERQAAYERKL